MVIFRLFFVYLNLDSYEFKQDMSWIYMNNEPKTECQDDNADLLDEIYYDC